MRKTASNMSVVEEHFKKLAQTDALDSIVDVESKYFYLKNIYE